MHAWKIGNKGKVKWVHWKKDNQVAAWERLQRSARWWWVLRLPEIGKGASQRFDLRSFFRRVGNLLTKALMLKHREVFLCFRQLKNPSSCCIEKSPICRLWLSKDVKCWSNLYVVIEKYNPGTDNCWCSLWATNL